MRAMCLPLILLAGCTPATPTTNDIAPMVSDPIEVRVSATLEHVPLRERAVTTEKLLAIRLAIANKGEGKRVTYRAWDAFGSDPKLTDEHGNNYARALGPTQYAEGYTPSATLNAGEKIGDIIVFEAPVPQATKLFLSLPAENVGGPAGVYLRTTIPRSLVRER